MVKLRVRLDGVRGSFFSVVAIDSHKERNSGSILKKCGSCEKKNMKTLKTRLPNLNLYLNQIKFTSDAKDILQKEKIPLKQVINFNFDSYDDWIKKGAQATVAAKKVLLCSMISFKE